MSNPNVTDRIISPQEIVCTIKKLNKIWVHSAKIAKIVTPNKEKRIRPKRMTQST